MSDFGKKVFSIFRMDSGIQCISFLLHIALAALLGPYNYGLFILLKLIPEYSEKFTRFYVDDAAVFLVGKGKFKLGEVAFNVVILSLLFSLIPIVILYFQVDLFSKWILKDSSIPHFWIWIVLGSIPCVFIFRCASKLILFQERMLAYNMLSFLPTVSGLLLGLIILVVFDVGVLGLLIGLTSVFFLAALYGMWFLFVQTANTYRFRLDIIKGLLEYGLSIYLPNLMLYILYRSDMLILAYFLTPKEVGYYSLAVSLVEVLRKIPRAVATLLFVRTTKVSDDESKSLTIKGCRHVVYLMLLLMLPALLMTKFILVPYIIGHTYDPIIKPFILLLPGMIGIGIFQVFMFYFYGRGRIAVVFWCLTPGVLINVGLNFLTIPHIGIAGAAVASSVAYCIIAVLLILYFRKIDRQFTVKDLFVFDRNDWLLYRNLCRSILSKVRLA